MEYLFFYGLFLAWLVAMVAIIPSPSSVGGHEKGELRKGEFGRVGSDRPDLRKAA